MTEWRWSYSTWKKFARCGYAVYLEKVRQVPVVPSVAGVAGNGFHTWTQRYDLGEFEHPEDVQTWEDCYFDAIEAEEDKTQVDRHDWRVYGRATKAAPNREDINYWLTYGWDLCKLYMNWAEGTDWTIARDLPPDNSTDEKTIGIEYAIQVDIGGETFIAYLDRLTRDVAGRLGIVDIKTGAQIRKEPQMDFYRAVGEKAGLPIEWHAYYNARKGVTTEPKFRPDWTPARLATVVKPQQDMRRNDIWPIVPGEHCAYCNVKPSCVYGLE